VRSHAEPGFTSTTHLVALSHKPGLAARIAVWCSHSRRQFVAQSHKVMRVHYRETVEMETRG
jgi:hypothetical protein